MFNSHVLTVRLMEALPSASGQRIAAPEQQTNYGHGQGNNQIISVRVARLAARLASLTVVLI
jgi:hypothetical protein